MKLNKVLAALLFLAALAPSALAQMPGMLCSGGQIACVIPGASFVTSSNTTILPGPLQAFQSGSLTVFTTISNDGTQAILKTTSGNSTIQLQTSCCGTIGSFTNTGFAPSDTNYLIATGSNGHTVSLGTGGAARITVNDSLITPVGDNAIAFGSNSARWSQGFFVTTQVGTTGTSGSLDLGGDFFWSGYPSEASTGSTLCVNAANRVTVNAAATCTVSALAFKENITAIPPSDALGLVLKMRPVNFDYKDHSGDWRNQFGLIADWAAELRPELATYDAEGNIHSFRYEQYAGAYLTGAIQALNARIEALEKK